MSLIDGILEAIYGEKRRRLRGPIPMILFCPNCGLQHVDRAEGDWTNPPHRSHLCHRCSHVWRPADVPTDGVAEIATAGSRDSDVIRRQASHNRRRRHQ